MTPTAWLLLSGGIDSAACIAFYLNQRFTVNCIHVSFGQPAEKYERIASNSIAQHYGVHLTNLRWQGSVTYRPREIVGRNAFLLYGALTDIGDDTGILATGIHAGTPYYDCSPAFLSAMQTIFDGYCGGTLRIAAPFLTWSKHDILLFCKSQRVPIELTYSCEAGRMPPCRRCPSCKDRELLRVL